MSEQRLATHYDGDGGLIEVPPHIQDTGGPSGAPEQLPEGMIEVPLEIQGLRPPEGVAGGHDEDVLHGGYTGVSVGTDALERQAQQYYLAAQEEMTSNRLADRDPLDSGLR